MTQYERLLDCVGQSDIVFDLVQNAECPAVTIEAYGHFGIFFDENGFTTDAERYVALAHEKGHCDSSAMYSVFTPLRTRDRCEAKAWKRAVLDSLPFYRLQEAFKACRTAEGVTLWDVAEYLGVTEEFVRRAVEIYERLGKRVW